MRVTVDANIIISAGLFPESNVGKALKHIMRRHNLVLSKYTLEELEEVFKRKFVKRIEYLNNFVNSLKYELIDIAINDYTKYPQVRDKDDIPLLACAIESKVDMLITGDKDFNGIEIENLKILKVRDYIDQYMK